MGSNNNKDVDQLSLKEDFYKSSILEEAETFTLTQLLKINTQQERDVSHMNRF